MNSRYDQSPRFSATGVATGSIPALIVAMAIPRVFDVQPTDASTGTRMAHTVSSHA